MRTPEMVLRYEVPVDDREHTLEVGPILHVNTRNPGVVEVWALNRHQAPRTFLVVGTGHPWPGTEGEWYYQGSAIAAGGALVWHLLERTEPVNTEEAREP